MTELIRSQTVTFLIFILFGSASGITLDVLRALQKCLHMYNIINILLDIAYGLAICVITIGLIYVYSQGNLYFYHIFGFFFGKFALFHHNKLHCFGNFQLYIVPNKSGFGKSGQNGKKVC